MGQESVAYEVDKESGDLNTLWESMLRWWRRELTREFSQSFRRISGTWKWVGSCQGIRQVTGVYVWIELAQESCLQDRREILKNKY